MASPNPTVPLHVTAKELKVLRDLLGYHTRCTTLRDKLSAARKDMNVATREARREAKNIMKARAERSAN